MEEEEDTVDSYKMFQVKSLTDWETFGYEQKFILKGIINKNWSQREIISNWKSTFHESIGFSAIKTCIIRSALSQFWIKGLKGGPNNYLCSQDMRQLETIIIERAEGRQALTTESALEEAEQLKVSRYKKALDFLKLIGCLQLAEGLLATEIRQPSRSWINSLEDKIDCYLSRVSHLDSNRFDACSPAVIDDYFNKFESIFAATPKDLFFVADETMMALSSRELKVLIPTSIKHYIESAPPDSVHITALCVHNLMAVKPPLFVILSQLRNTPNELQSLVQSGKIWLGSSSAGWMDRELFMCWSINFINWLHYHRTTLPSTICDKPAVLLLDGHPSRQCPAALHLFRFANVHVIVLPSHTTHLLQVFDVILAAPLKSAFTKIFNEYKKKKKYVIPNNQAATMRNLLVHSMIAAFDAVCTVDNVHVGARKTGIMPVNREVVKASEFVREPTNEEQNLHRQQHQRNHLCTNNCLLTDSAKIQEISDAITCSDILKSKFDESNGVTAQLAYMNYTNACIRSINNGSSRWLSRTYPFQGFRYPE